MPFSTLHQEDEDDESSLDRPAADRRGAHVRRHGVCGAARRDGALCRAARGRRPDRARRRPRPAAPGSTRRCRHAARTTTVAVGLRRSGSPGQAMWRCDRAGSKSRVGQPTRSGMSSPGGCATERSRAECGSPSSSSISSASTTRMSATRARGATAVSGADDRPRRGRLPLVALARAARWSPCSGRCSPSLPRRPRSRRSRARPGRCASLLRATRRGRADGVAIRSSASMDAPPRCTPIRSRSAFPAHAVSRTARQGKLIPIETAVESGHRAASEARTLRFTRCPRPRQ